MNFLACLRALAIFLFILASESKGNTVRDGASSKLWHERILKVSISSFGRVLIMEIPSNSLLLVPHGSLMYPYRPHRLSWCVSWMNYTDLAEIGTLFYRPGSCSLAQCCVQDCHLMRDFIFPESEADRYSSVMVP